MADALRVTAPANLPALVKTAFSRATTNGDLTYYQTQVALLTAALSSSASSSSPAAQHPPATPPFQLRFSPALASKPKNPKPSTTGEKKTPFNPFANPDPALVIAKLGQHHTLVLNKFAIVPGHFLVITNSFKSQTHLLEADDLEAAYSCVRAYSQDATRTRGKGRQTATEHTEEQEEDEGSELFVFFNSGPFSGASQPHRHLQLLPVESMKIGLSLPTPASTTSSPVSGTRGAGGNAGWTPLINTLHNPTPTIEAGQADGPETSGGPTPFRIFSAPITPDMLPNERHAVYTSLYRRACEAVHTYEITQRRGATTSPAPAENKLQATRTTEPTGEGASHEGDEAQISYNLAMTNNVMALCPRLAEGSAIRDNNGVTIGKMELNGTVLAGTALVKSEAEWDAVRRNPDLLRNVLSKIGIPTRAIRDIHTDSIRDSTL